MFLIPVNPLTVDLATLYHFLTPQAITTYPFTTASIIIKALGLFPLPLWLFSSFKGHHCAKSETLLVLAALMQLYALQEVTTGNKLVPLEWSLSLSVSEIVLLVPMIFFLSMGEIASAHRKLSGAGSAGDNLYDNEEEEEE